MSLPFLQLRYMQWQYINQQLETYIIKEEKEYQNTLQLVWKALKTFSQWRVSPASRAQVQVSLRQEEIAKKLKQVQDILEQVAWLKESMKSEARWEETKTVSKYFQDGVGLQFQQTSPEEVESLVESCIFLMTQLDEKEQNLPDSFHELTDTLETIIERLEAKLNSIEPIRQKVFNEIYSQMTSQLAKQ